MSPARRNLNWPLDALGVALRGWYGGLNVEVLGEIDSTNSELMRRVRAGAVEPVLLVAERQTAGRGRLGRGWEAGVRGASLMFSLGLPLAPRDWSGLSLAVGLSVAESLDPDGTAGLMLKWPNDIWRQDRKLGGILIETALPQGEAGSAMARYVVIGVGLNIAARAGDGLRTPPAWWREWRPRATAADALSAVAPSLLRAVLRFADEGFAPFAAGFAARDALRGREVLLSDGSTGRCEGIGEGGELLVHGADGIKAVTSSEISVRPRSKP